MNKFCYWSIGDRDHGKMLATLVESARRAGVKEDFHLWTDNQNIKGAICHPCGNFDKAHYLFKFSFLKEEVSKLDYDYFVFLDSDCFFRCHPGEGVFDTLLRSNRWFIQLENECTSKFIKREGWWDCPIRWYILLLRYFGVKSPKIFNTNAGFWIVRKEAIPEFYDLTMKFFNFCRDELHLVTFTEEPPLAYVGHLVDDPELNTLDKTSHVWCSDWTGCFHERLPDNNAWDFVDYMTGEKKKVFPAIVHCMRAKNALIKGIPR